MRSLSEVLKYTNIIEGGFYSFESMSKKVSIVDPSEVLSSEKYEELLWRARNEAREIVEKADQVSKRLMDNAAQKAKIERKNAQELGYAEGLKKGREEALAMTKTAISELQLLLQSIEKEKEAVLKKHEDDLQELALGIARKVIDSELQKDDKAFLSIYKNAVQELSGQEWVKVSVSEFDKEFATSNSELLKSMVRGAKSIKVIVLEGAPRGTCVVETPQSIADAGVETQIARIKEAFMTLSVPV